MSLVYYFFGTECSCATTASYRGSSRVESVGRCHRLDLQYFNPSTGTLKLQSNGPLYSNTVIGTLAVDAWAVTFGAARRGLCGLRPRSGLSSLYQM